MHRGPSWMLRFAALALASAPFLHPSSMGSGGSFRPFENLPVLGNLFDQAPAGWLFCWVLPFAASFPAWRGEGVTSGFTFAAYLALLISLMASRVPGSLVLAQTAGAVFIIILLISRVETEAAAAWARILLGAVLMLACLLSWLDKPSLSIGLAGVALGGLLVSLGELWALRGVPPEEPTK